MSTVQDAGDQASWNFADGGPAASDWAANEQPSGWGSQPLQEAYRTGAMIWYLVRDQASAVADLLDSGRSVGLLSASRSLAESCGRCWLLLETKVDPAERIRRMIVERLYALFEEWRYARDVPVLDDSWQLATSDRLVEVARSEFGMPIGERTDRDAAWVGKRREPTMRLLGRMLDRPDYAAMFYRNTSAVAHATLNGITKRLEMRTDASDTYRARLREMTSGESAVEIQVGVASCQIAARALLIQTGWDMTRFEVADVELVNVYQALIDSVPAPVLPG